MNVIQTALDAEALSGLRDLAAGDDAFLDDLFAIYIDQANETVATLRATLERSDHCGFSAAAHRLGSASLNVGALFVASVCHAIESAMSDHGARPSAAHLHAVEHELKRVVFAIATLAVV